MNPKSLQWSYFKKPLGTEEKKLKCPSSDSILDYLCDHKQTP